MTVVLHAFRKNIVVENVTGAMGVLLDPGHGVQEHVLPPLKPQNEFDHADLHHPVVRVLVLYIQILCKYVKITCQNLSKIALEKMLCFQPSHL